MSMQPPEMLSTLSFTFWFALVLFFTDRASAVIYTLSLHDALPISRIALTAARQLQRTGGRYALVSMCVGVGQGIAAVRSEEHTSELQSLTNLVCRLLLEKKKIPHTTNKSNSTLKPTTRARKTHSVN